jgi:hypothetical protein
MFLFRFFLQIQVPALCTVQEQLASVSAQQVRALSSY